MDKKRFEVHVYFEIHEGAIILVFGLWLLISVAAADYFCVFYLYLTLLLSSHLIY